MLERILVAYDGSHHSRHACDLGVEVAGRFAASLTMVVVRPPNPDGVDDTLEDLVPAAEGGRTFADAIDEIRRRATARGARRVDVVYLRGEALEQILGWLRTHPQDLVVVGSRGLSRGRRILMGSVSSGLVSDAPCPVLVVRGHAGARAHGKMPSPPAPAAPPTVPNP